MLNTLRQCRAKSLLYSQPFNIPDPGAGEGECFAKFQLLLSPVLPLPGDGGWDRATSITWSSLRVKSRRTLTRFVSQR